MAARRLIPAFLLALLASALLTWGLARKLARPRVVQAAPLQRVVVATKEMHVGDTLSAASLQAVDWPARALPAGVFHRPEEAAGHVLLVPVASGTPVLEGYLARPGVGGGMPAKIPDGMRAVSVHADAVTGVDGFVTPDSFVDVLTTTNNPGQSETLTATILQDVRVLAVGQDNQGGAAKGIGGGSETVTLLLSPADAQRLTFSGSLGKIVFVLRNGADRGTVAGLTPDRKVDARFGPGALGGAAAGAPVAAKLPPASALPAMPGASAPVQRKPGDFAVETIAGGKQRVETFGGGGTP